MRLRIQSVPLLPFLFILTPHIKCILFCIGKKSGFKSRGHRRFVLTHFIFPAAQVHLESSTYTDFDNFRESKNNPKQLVPNFKKVRLVTLGPYIYKLAIAELSLFYYGYYPGYVPWVGTMGR